MTERDVQRWSREVAQDPGAPSFVRLARAYRRQGRRGAARDVVVRGLARNPEHLEGHSLLALMHVEEGDAVRARDEWETVLRLDPDHFEASRGLGFLALERRDFDAARKHLEAAARVRPGDVTIAQALQVLDRKVAATTPTTPTPPATPIPTPAPPATAQLPPGPALTGAAGATMDSPAGGRAQPDATAQEPDRLFDALGGEPCFDGALLLDFRGMVLAGRLNGGEEGAGELLGALLDGVVAEAIRTAELVHLGEWRELMLDCDAAMVHVASLPGRAVVAAKLRPRTPAGWVVRLAGTARNLATRFMEGSP
jgi:tetratricopeptide (TPR) repeat protein